MLYREKYGLIFNRVKVSDGSIWPKYIISHPEGESIIGNNDSVLTILYTFTIHECECFIDDLNKCIDNQYNIDEGFFSGSTEHMKILYQYPNVNIDDLLIIPMQDLKELLQEWLNFISD